MKQQLNNLLSTEMDRRDFLKYLAAASIMAVGGGVILQSLGGMEKLGLSSGQKSHDTTPAMSTYGYGGSIYGGNQS